MYHARGWRKKCKERNRELEERGRGLEESERESCIHENWFSRGLID